MSPLSDEDGELPSEVLDAIRSNRKVEAIKLLREATGMDLEDAKRRVEAARPPPAVGPSGGTVQRGGGGRGLVLLVLIAAAIAGYLWLTSG